MSNPFIHAPLSKQTLKLGIELFIYMHSWQHLDFLDNVMFVKGKSRAACALEIIQEDFWS